MTLRGKDLKKEFNALFDKLKKKEDRLLPNKKRTLKKYQSKLVPKHSLNALSPLFQDPDLLVEITGGNVQFLTGRSNISRRRNLLENVTTSRPQAKDVSSTRVHDDADLSNDNTVLDGFYHHPKGPKKRIYIAESEEQPSIPSTSEPSPSSETVFSVAPRLSELALPTHSVANSVTNTNADSGSDEENGSGVELQSFLKRTAELLKSSTLDTIKYNGMYSLLPRLTQMKQYRYIKPEKNIIKKSTPTQIGSDTVITITVFSEVDRNLCMQEIEILGSQELRDLRKAIICPFGYGMQQHQRQQRGEVNSTTSFIHREEEHCIMFIEDAFYSDVKNPKTEKIIADWLSGKTEKSISDFPFQRMGRQMQNLFIELNKPYCLIHYGKCEHMFVVRDMRLLSDKDHVDSFPHSTCNLKYTRYKCSMCSVFPASYVTKNDILSGFSPCYFCNRCYYSFHTNVESEVHQENFEVKPYYGDIV